MRKLPASWAWATFGDVARVASNLVDPSTYPDHPHIAPNHIESRTGRLLPYTTVRADGVTSSKHLFRPGQLLYSKIRPYLAKVVTVEFEGLCSADMYPVETALESRFLLHWLLSAEFTALAAEQQGRSVLPKINREALAKLPVPLPPAAEQSRIASALEEQLSRLDAAEAALIGARRRVAGLCSQLINDAVEGDLLPLGALVREPLRNGVSARASEHGTVRVVTLTAVTRGEFVDENTKLIEPGARDVEDLWMQPGDVFVQRSNTPELVGTAALYRGNRRWAIFPDLLIRVRPNHQLDPGYLALVLRSSSVRRYFQQSAQGIAGSMPKISQPIVEATMVPLPPIDRQTDIVQRVAQDSEVIERAGAAVDEAIARGRALRRAIHSAAFSGRLVPQHPEDEPASVLLDRIRAERANAPRSRSRRRRAVAS